MTGMQDHARQEDGPEGLELEEREDHDADHHHKEQKAGAAARVQGRFPARIFDGQLFPRLPGVDDLVLGAVILEDAPDVLHPADEQDIGQEEDDPDHPVDQIEDDPVVDWRRNSPSARL